MLLKMSTKFTSDSVHQLYVCLCCPHRAPEVSRGELDPQEKLERG